MNLKFVYLLILLPGFLQASESHDLQKYYYAYLLESLRNTRQKHNISYQDMNETVGKYVLGSEKISKGGTGIIREGIYVVTDYSTSNLALINGNEWSGLSSQTMEVVYTDGNTVSDSIVNYDLNNVVIIIYSPSEIRFIDYFNNNGGVYFRDKE